jgi:hypothetical protein
MTWDQWLVQEFTPLGIHAHLQNWMLIGRRHRCGDSHVPEQSARALDGVG